MNKLCSACAAAFGSATPFSSVHHSVSTDPAAAAQLGALTFQAHTDSELTDEGKLRAAGLLTALGSTVSQALIDTYGPEGTPESAENFPLAASPSIGVGIASIIAAVAGGVTALTALGKTIYDAAKPDPRMPVQPAPTHPAPTRTPRTPDVSALMRQFLAGQQKSLSPLQTPPFGPSQDGFSYGSPLDQTFSGQPSYDKHVPDDLYNALNAPTFGDSDLGSLGLGDNAYLSTDTRSTPFDSDDFVIDKVEEA